jgi:NifU-like protein
LTLQQLITSFPWARYSKKLKNRIDQPRAFGVFTKDEAEARDLRLAIGKEGDIKDGNELYLYMLVDKDDGIIVDVRYKAFGQSALIGALEAASDLLIGKNYDQAKRISAELIDKQLRDKSETFSFPRETYAHVNLVISAIEQAAEQCTDLPLALNYVAPPAPMDIGEVREGGYPGYQELSQNQKLAVIEDVLNQDVRPYIALDAGGVTVLDLLNDKEVLISYQGSCTSCYSSVGTTLSFIQQVLRAKIHPQMIVTPDLTNTGLSR